MKFSFFFNLGGVMATLGYKLCDFCYCEHNDSIQLQLTFDNTLLVTLSMGQ